MRIHSLCFLSLLILTAFGCQKDDISSEIIEEEVPINIDAGDNFENIAEFQIMLDASQPEEDENGEWTIFSGLEDEKVSFEDKNDPKTIFNGLPGEEYKLIWTITKEERTAKDTIMVSFTPLETEIIDTSLDFYNTKRHLNAKEYDKGIWTVEGGEYVNFLNQNFTDSREGEESPHVIFYGHENKEYILTWTTWYGSKSASASIAFNSSEFHQYEALEDLRVLDRPWRYKENDQGNVVELNMGGDTYAWRIGALDLYPSMQALKHLKKLIIYGDGFYQFPEVITSHYLDLEVLDASSNAFSTLPHNIGNLKKLDSLKIYNNQDNKDLLSLPESFGEMENLSYLKMSGMGIRNLPESFGNLSNLKFLNLDSNLIYKLPDNFGNLINLETFRGPGLETNLPDSFSNLESLKFCFFTIYSDFYPVLPEDIGRLSNLETFWIGGKFQHLPDSFGNLDNLKDLEITGDSRLIDLPDSFGNLVNLEKLRVAGRFTSFPLSFSNLTNLKFLTVHSLLEYLPEDINKMEKLEGIIVDQNNLKEIPEQIGALSNLTYFSAYLNEITTIPDSFGNLSNLNELDLSYNEISIFPNSMTDLSDTLLDFRIRGNTYSEEEFQRLKDMLPSTRIER